MKGAWRKKKFGSIHCRRVYDAREFPDMQAFRPTTEKTCQIEKGTCMNEIKITNAVKQLCNMIETKIIGKDNTSVDCGAILLGKDIDDYSIESVNHIKHKDQIAITVHFHSTQCNHWYGRFYFLDATTLE